MSPYARAFSVLGALLLTTVLAVAQDVTPSAPPSPASLSFPALMRYTGRIAPDADGARRSVVGVTFALYEQQEGGAPLWLETHNVAPDKTGSYTVFLGANSRDGLPLELFATTEARWLGIHLEGGAELPRVMLVSVPYALKAAEADKLAGRSASDFVLHEKLSEQVRQEVEAAATDSNKAMTTTGGGTLAVTASGTPGRVAMFTGVDALGDSTITDSAGNVGVGTTTPPNRFAINSTSAILPSTMQISHPGGDWGLVFKRTFNDAGHPNFTFLKTRGETAVPAQSGDGVGRIVWQAVNAAGSPAPVYVGDISMFAPTVSGANVAGDMRFSTKSLTGGVAERMRISPEGNVGVGSTNPPNRFAINATVAILPSTMQISHPGGDWGLVFKRNTNDNGFPNFTFLKTRGEGAVAAQVGDGVGRIVFQAVNASGTPVYVGDMGMVATAVTASDVASDMRFSTRSTTIGLAERMRITPEGRVGIGTTNPSTTLHVNGNITATNVSATTLNSVAAANYTRNDVNNTLVGSQTIGAGTTKLYFDPAGKLGIGDFGPNGTLGAPTQALDVRGNIQVGEDFPWGGAEDNVYINFGDHICGALGGQPCVYFGEYDADDRLTFGAQYFVFAATETSEGANPGNVGIGALAQDFKLEVTGGALKTDGGTAWSVPSDERLKKDVATVSDALTLLNRLRPVRFRYNDAYQKTFHASDKLVYNYLAQEYQQVFPDFVKARKRDGMLMIDTSPTTPLAVAAIQELHKMVLEKDATIAQQSQRIDTLEALLKNFEQRLARVEGQGRK